MLRSRAGSVAAAVASALAATLFGLTGCELAPDEGDAPGSGASAASQTALPRDPALDAILEAALDETRSPGIAAAIVRDGELAWASGVGLANVAERRPVTSDTLFQIASTAKTVTAAAVMQLVERGVLSLDAPIEGLPFDVRNPRLATAPITVRSLLTHTSGIRDPEVNLYRPGDTTIGLERYLRGTLLVGGEFYQTSNWAARAPGVKYEYSNTGITLLGYLVEQKGGRSFDAHCEAAIFEPLQMKETSFRLAGLDASHVAMPYEGKPGSYRALGHYGYPDVPAGMLRTSARQLSSFLRMFMRGGELGGVRVLAPGSVAEMSKVQTRAASEGPDQGLVWYHEVHGSRRLLMHDGQDPGAFTIMGFDPSTRIGAILLTNGDAESSRTAEAAVYALFDRLLTAGERLGARRP